MTYRYLSNHEKKAIVALKMHGFSIYEISKALNRHPSTIYYYLRRAGLC
ncbi:MAG: hypothetical protein DRJ47_06610 [Thermoprotei archaeon]|nr:MAG: hypothetical protein DRJ47_06610 [Thermoprotei archaeon]